MCLFKSLTSALAISKIIKLSFTSITKKSREVALLNCCLEINILFSSMDSVIHYQPLPTALVGVSFALTPLIKVSEIMSALICLSWHNEVPRMGCLQFCRPEVQNQSARGIGSFWGLWGRICPMHLPQVLGPRHLPQLLDLLAILGIPWFGEASPWPLPSSSCAVLLVGPNFFYLQGHKLYWGRTHPTPVWPHLN